MFSLLEPFICGFIPYGTVNTLDFNPVTVNSFNHCSFQLLYSTNLESNVEACHNQVTFVAISLVTHKTSNRNPTNPETVAVVSVRD
jgi:hypothetical protein